MKKAVLLIVDMLEDFFKSGTLAHNRGKLTSCVNQVIEIFRIRNLPIIWIRQEYLPDLSDAPLVQRRNKLMLTIANSRGSQILPELDYQGQDETIIKKRYSAFWGTNLDEVLKSLNPESIVLAGINTHACIRTTAIDAYQRDYKVWLVEDCVSSYDDEHHRITINYLNKGMATSVSKSILVELLDSSKD